MNELNEQQQYIVSLSKQVIDLNEQAKYLSQQKEWEAWASVMGALKDVLDKLAQAFEQNGITDLAKEIHTHAVATEAILRTFKASN